MVRQMRDEGANPNAPSMHQDQHILLIILTIRPIHHRGDGQAQGGGMARVVVRLQNGLFRTLDRLHLRPGGGAGDAKGKRSA